MEEVEDLSRTATAVGDQPPWEALVSWLHRFVGYMHTKQALAQELLDYVDRDAPVFQSCRAALYEAGEPLLARAQAAHVVRADATLPDVIQMVGGIARITTTDPGQVRADPRRRARRPALPRRRLSAISPRRPPSSG